MMRCLDFMKSSGGKIHRHAGGYWTCGNLISFENSFGSTTVQALVDRSLVQFTEHRDGRYGRFPITAELMLGATP